MKSLFLVCLLAGAGCASYPQPHQNIAESLAAVEGAKEAGAPRVPDAQLHLTLAQDQLQEARELMEEGENEKALYMAEQAEADARLAHALARRDEMRRRAQQAEQAAKQRKEDLTATRDNQMQAQ